MSVGLSSGCRVIVVVVIESVCINEWIDVWTLKKYHDKSRLCVRCVFCEYVGENNDDVWHVRVCVSSRCAC